MNNARINLCTRLVTYVGYTVCIILAVCHNSFSQEEAFTTMADRNNLPEVSISNDDDIPSPSPFTFGANIQGGIVRNFSGGLKKGSDYMGRIHLTVKFDTKIAGLWNGGEFFINGVSAHGGTPTARLIGDFQPISRNEATERTALFEFWYKHTFGKFSILAGQHDMNSSFGTSESAGRSIHSAFGMYPSVTPNAGYSFSIFPRTMPAVVTKYSNPRVTVQAAAYAGASNNFNKDPYNLTWNLDESVYLVGEFHYNRFRQGVQQGKYKLGVFHHTGEFPDVTNPTNRLSGNSGIYVIADHMLIPETQDANQGLMAFFQTGMASGNQNLIDLFTSAGITYRGLLPGRDKDVLFIGMVDSFINRELREASGTIESSRAIVELNYALQLGSHFTLQPDVQYIINPGANPTLENALLGILRFSINY